MPDASEPLNALLASRAAFGSSTEAVDLVAITDERLRKGGRVDWLEVGAGDGRHLQFQLDSLSASRTLHAIALEPAVVRPTISGAVEWATSRAEDFESDRLFDWINVRHSAYYFNEPLAVIQKFVGMLGASGALALTHWSQDCILRRLHVALCDNQSVSGCYCIEEIAEFFRQDLRVEVAGLSLHDTKLDVDRVLADAGLAHALYDLARRGYPATAAAAEDPSGTVAHLLRTLPNSWRRRNGILLLQLRSV